MGDRNIILTNQKTALSQTVTVLPESAFYFGYPCQPIINSSSDNLIISVGSK